MPIADSDVDPATTVVVPSTSEPPSPNDPKAGAGDGGFIPALTLGDVAAQQPAHTLYRYRFLVAAAVFFANFGNSAIWATYASVTPSTATYFSTSSWKINLLSLLFQAVFPLFIIPGGYVLDTHGVRPTVLIGAWLTAVGALIRWLSFLAPNDGRFAVLVVGHMLAAVAQPFLLEVSTKTAACWFGDKERLTANTVMSLGQPLGAALILELAPSIVTDPSAIPTLNLITFLIVLVFALLSLTMRSVPPGPPDPNRAHATAPPMGAGREARGPDAPVPVRRGG
ncbi:Major facilitator super domain-containing protein 7, partial [Irineochytrium annulatum]